MSTVASTRTAPGERVVAWAVGGGARFCLLLWVAQRVLIQGLGAVVTAIAGPARYSLPGPFGTYYNWDSGWFGCIVSFGYLGPACVDGATDERFAFFPLYPLLARGVAWSVGGGSVTSGSTAFGLWLVAALASLAAVGVLYRLADHLYGAAVARRATALLLFGPYAVFLVASYSESLYLATALAAWYCCLRRRYLACGLFGALATATRVSGLFLVPALVVLYLVETRRAGRPLRWAELVPVAASGLGVAAYWGWLALRTGDPMAWFTAQDDGWNRRTQWPWLTLVNQGIHVLREPRWDWQVQAVLEVLFAGLLCLAVLVLLRRRDWAAALLVGATAASLMTSTSYLSLARNTLTLFPLVLLLALWSRASRARFAVTLAVGVVLMLYHATCFALGYWAD